MCIPKCASFCVVALKEIVQKAAVKGDCGLRERVRGFDA